MKCVLAIIIAVVVLQCEGKTFTRCELVHELRRQGFPQWQMRDWVCVVEKSSSRRTFALRYEANGSRSYGLFQINDRWWCNSSSVPGKECNAICSDFLTPDITRASRCARIIYSQRGFDAWTAWRNLCQGNLPDISNC